MCSVHCEILTQLPQELWCHIFSFVNEWSLLKLMTVSKDFKRTLEESFTTFDCSWRRLRPSFVVRLTQFKNLHTLHFTTTKSTLHHIFELKKLNYLTIEQLDRESLTSDSFSRLGELKYLTRMWMDAHLMDTTYTFVMFQATSLRRLILYCPFSQSLLDAIANHSNLHYLCLIDNDTNNESTHIYRIPFYSSLTCFELLNTNHIFDAADVIKLTSLRSLALHYTDNILNYDLVARLTSLNELIVHTERDVMDKISVVTTLSNLTKLDFYTPRLDESKLSYLIRMSSLRSLVLERVVADPIYIQTNLQYLTLLGLATPKSENFSSFLLLHTQLCDLYIQSKNCQRLDLQTITLLQNLSRLTFGPISVSDFPSILKLTKLTKLRLTLRNLEDRQIPQLDQIFVLSRLTSLYCVHFHFTTSALFSVVQIRSLRSLSFVHCTFDKTEDILLLSQLEDLTHLRLKGDTLALFRLSKKLRKIVEYGIIYEGPIPPVSCGNTESEINDDSTPARGLYTQIYV